LKDNSKIIENFLIKRLDIQRRRRFHCFNKLIEKMNAENKDLQHLAKRACVSYLRSVYLMKDKSVFKVSEIDPLKLAQSYGLINAPLVEIVSKREKGDRIAMLREQA
jgi:ATP-dependent RNA helicase DDX10/DBP4